MIYFQVVIVPSISKYDILIIFWKLHEFYHFDFRKSKVTHEYLQFATFIKNPKTLDNILHFPTSANITIYWKYSQTSSIAYPDHGKIDVIKNVDIICIFKLMGIQTWFLSMHYRAGKGRELCYLKCGSNLSQIWLSQIFKEIFTSLFAKSLGSGGIRTGVSWVTAQYPCHYTNTTCYEICS